GIELGEDAFGRRAEVRDQLVADLVIGNGRSAVLQLAELRDPFGLEQVDAARQHLPELDEAGPELLEGASHPRRGAELRMLGGGAPVQRETRAFERAAQPDPAHDVAEAVADED